MAEKEPQVFTVSKDLGRWRFSRRDFLVATGGAVAVVVVGATVGCQGAQETVAPTQVPSGAHPWPMAHFVTDATIPDGTVIGSGQQFTKTWRVANNGLIPWGAETLLAFDTGTQMGAPKQLSVGDVAPGVTVDISVNMVAPTEPGEYMGQWVLQASDGTAMVTLEVNIQVPEPPGVRGTVRPGQRGINATGPGGETRTMPCGTPIPPGWTCACNCVTAPSGCTCVGHSTCTCVGHCSCDSQGTHYWYPC